jgi:hypothetical protein
MYYPTLEHGALYILSGTCSKLKADGNPVRGMDKQVPSTPEVLSVDSSKL